MNSDASLWMKSVKGLVQLLAVFLQLLSKPVNLKPPSDFVDYSSLTKESESMNFVLQRFLDPL